MFLEHMLLTGDLYYTNTMTKFEADCSAHVWSLYCLHTIFLSLAVCYRNYSTYITDTLMLIWTSLILQIFGS